MLAKLKHSNISLSAILASIFSIWVIIDIKTPPKLAVESILFITWLLTYFFENKMQIFNMLKNKEIIFLLLFIAYMIISSLPVDDINTAAKRGYAMLMIMSPIMFYSCYSKNIKSLYLIAAVSLTAFIFCTVNSIFLYSNDKNIPVILLKEMYYYGPIAVGNTLALAGSLGIFITFLISLLFGRFFYTAATRLFSIIIIFLSLICLYYTRSAIYLLIAFGGLFVGFTTAGFNIESDKKFAKKIMLLLMLFLSLILILFYSETIGNILIEISKPQTSKLLNRVNSLGQLLRGDPQNTDNFDAFDRLFRISSSFKTFLKSPIFGINFKTGSNFYNQAQFGIGSHSQWLDQLGRYGIIGSLPYFSLYYLLFKKISSYNKIPISYAWFIIMLFIGFVNPIDHASFYFTSFLIIPTIYLFLSNRYIQKQGDTEC